MLRKMKIFHKIYNLHRTVNCSAHARRFSSSKENNKDEITSSIATKFQVFRNESVGEILDIEEERTKLREQQEMDIAEDLETELLPPSYSDINLERGLTGVFDIHDLVDLLKRENAIDLCVIKVPKQYSYVDYMVITTGSTYRHMLGMASFVRKIFKLKRESHDFIPKIEGKESKDWMAMDLGNIALHIFSRSSREHYDLETLWTLGEEYEKRVRGRSETTESLYEEFFSKIKESSDMDVKHLK